MRDSVRSPLLVAVVSSFAIAAALLAAPGAARADIVMLDAATAWR